MRGHFDMGQRIRLDEYERIYLIDLVNENVKLQGALVSLSIRKLLRKLGDDTVKASKARNIQSKLFRCSENDCDRVVRGGAGLSRHTSAAHHRPPTENEKSPIEESI